MPHTDGIEATSILKQKWHDIRVLVLTTFQETSKAVEVLRCGAEGYLLKSLEPRELAETIRLVYRGGTLIDSSISSQLFEEHTMVTNKAAFKAEQQADVPNYGLTSREIEILQWLSKGLRYKLIAAKLFLSDGTVRNYASNAYLKLGVRTREEAVQKASEAGLLSPK